MAQRVQGLGLWPWSPGHTRDTSSCFLDVGVKSSGTTLDRKRDSRNAGDGLFRDEEVPGRFNRFSHCDICTVIYKVSSACRWLRVALIQELVQSST
jgi:hypothetical protein